MRPLIYGYLRACMNTPDDDIAAGTRCELTDYAEREGFTLAEIFLEHPDLPDAAFNGLRQAIGRTQTKDILVPDPSHFGTARKALIEQQTGARVWMIRP